MLKLNLKIIRKWSSDEISYINSLLASLLIFFLLCQDAHSQLSSSVKNAAKNAVKKTAIKNAPTKPTVTKSEKNSTIKSLPSNNVVRAKLPILYKENGQVIKQWVTPLCSKQSKCPLPEHIGKTFKSGVYNEKVLQDDIYLYRVYSNKDFTFNNSKETFTYWSRSQSKGTQAIIEKALPIDNKAENLVKLKVPKGTTIFEGQVSKEGKLSGGANQVVLKKDDIEKIMTSQNSVYYE